MNEFEDQDEWEGEEEERREMEAFLYSQIHHEVNDCQSQGVTISPVDSGIFITSNEGSWSPPPVQTDGAGGGNTSDVDSESDDDDGIQVLSSPQVVSNVKGTPVLRVSNAIDTSEESDDDDDEVQCLTPATDPGGSNKRIRSEKVLVSHEPKPVAGEMNKNVFICDSSSSEDSEDDDEGVDSPDLSLNFCGGLDQEEETDEFLNQIKVQASESTKMPGPNVPQNWTKEMETFYNEVDYDLLRSNIGDMLNSIPKAQKHWKIDPADRYSGSSPSSSYRRSRYFQRRRCSNCNEVGHVLRECKKPLKNSCNVCGEEGHRRQYCPYQCCLRCGNPDVSYSSGCDECRKLNHSKCLHCEIPGHRQETCPDYWRMYHMTTKPGSTCPVEPKSDIHKEERDIWCPSCGCKGHHFHCCRAYRMSAYPYVNLNVISYEVDISPELQRKLQRQEKQRRKKLRRKSRAKENSEESFQTPEAKRRKLSSCSINNNNNNSNSCGAKSNQKIHPVKKFESPPAKFDVTNVTDDLADEIFRNVTKLSGKERWSHKRKEKRLMKRKNKKKEDEKLFSLDSVKFSNKKSCQNRNEFRMKRGFIARSENHGKKCWSAKKNSKFVSTRRNARTSFSSPNFFKPAFNNKQKNFFHDFD